VENLARLTAHIRTELAKVIVGQRETVDQLLIVLACGGHALLEGVPGLAKTLTIKTLSRICGLGFQRVQCTADLMPADIIGTNVFNLATSQFTLHRGPMFTDLLLVDEINRTTARTQAALLEAMEERQATIDGVRYPLGTHFTVFATQNPVEFEGTYPLPEAQLDRFLLKIRIEYPTAEEEGLILKRFETLTDAHLIEQVPVEPLDPAVLAGARAEIAQMRVEPALYQYIVAVIRRTRDWPALSLGASPRAAIGLFFVSRAIAGMEDRDFLIPDDVKAAAPAVLRHRLMLKPEADLEGLTADSVIAEILAAVEVPK
jgi:MoxR-like ATPase